jgi:DNA mismatch repair protein MutL
MKHDNPPRIRRLSDHLANRIAAGEVIERPASVVKELVENSLDAGARHIRIDVEQSGRRLIRVRDDGCGIHCEDLSLALDRHATSKLHDDHDLISIDSLGFRGEALPSIGAVARLLLQSRTEDSEHGWQLSCQGSDVSNSIQPVAHDIGTTVDVRDLFFNTPARRRFLRTDKTELLHIREQLENLSLARFDVAFNVRHNQREFIRLSAAMDQYAEEQRIIRILGKAFMDEAVYIEFSASGLQLRGWLSNPASARSSSTRQYLFVNGRAVRDRMINHAIRQVYEQSGFNGIHPAYVLYLDLEHDLVDVNVHPAKHEVRFRNNRLVHDFFTSRLRKALQGGAGSVADRYQRPAAEEQTVQERQPVYGAPGLAEHALRYLTRINNRYLVAEDPNGLLLVDVSRLLRCRLITEMSQQLQKNGEVVSKPLLIPVVVNIPEPRVELVLLQHERLQQMGMNIDQAGPGQIALRSLPDVMAGIDAEKLLQALVTIIESGHLPELDQLVSVLPVDSYRAQRPEELLSWIEQYPDSQAVRHITVSDLDNLFRIR